MYTHKVTYHAAGEDAEKLKPGDFLLTRGDALYSRFIRVGQGFMYPKPYRLYTHAALVVGEDGTLAEALWNGVRLSPLEKYRNKPYAIVRVYTSAENVREMMAFAQSVLAAHIGYDYLTIMCLALSLPTRGKIYFGRAGTSICSQFVAQALYRCGYISHKPPNEVMPADLAFDFGVDRA